MPGLDSGLDHPKTHNSAILRVLAFHGMPWPLRSIDNTGQLMIIFTWVVLGTEVREGIFQIADSAIVIGLG